ncbi:MAG: tRNA-dihydrouridine synthase family protein [Deltaproteobacteria bacterium]|nr:tRNA-dihydrouridine synthase family protein [Deltaproteobacteria bacterium]
MINHKQTASKQEFRNGFAEGFIGLAPMEGVTNLAMRLWFHLVAAPQVMATPFLRVTATYPQRELPREFAPELDELRSYLPYRLVPQLMAAETDDFLRVAPALLEHCDFVELNCGCPSPKCVGKGAGSSLLRDPDEFGAMASRISGELGPTRFAIKMRTGFQSASEFNALIEPLRQLPLARLTVHGRTRPSRYTGQADWDLIERAAQRAVAPVVASGDITDLKSLRERLAMAPSVSRVIIGRGALRNPWIFSELRQSRSERLPFQTLKISLMVQALLHELMATDPAAVYALCKDGCFTVSCGMDYDRWAKLYGVLATKLWPGHSGYPEHLREVSRATLGRVKLVWNYLRSSLPTPFFAPLPLRAANIEEFIQALEHCYSLMDDPADLELKHNPDLDWVYNGEKKVKVGESPSAGVPQAPL